MAIPVKLPVFEGPLDLLMHLIEKNKIDIYDIPIAEITDQYLEYVHQMDREDLDVTSEFLVMAATLLDIKSRMLLPREKDEETGEEEGDPREELVRRLLEYKMYKYLSEELAVCREQAGVRYFRAQNLPKEVLNYRPPINYDELLKGTDLQKLQKVFGEVLRRKKSRRDPIRSGFGKIKREEISIDNKTLYVRAYLQAHPHTDFRALLESQESREEVIVTFLILLELMKTQKVHIVQDTIGGKILVEAGAGDTVSDEETTPSETEKPSEETDSFAETDSHERADSFTETDSHEKADSFVETDSHEKADSFVEMDSDEKADSFVETDSLEKADSFAETDSSDEAEFSGESESGEETEDQLIPGKAGFSASSDIRPDSGDVFIESQDLDSTLSDTAAQVSLPLTAFKRMELVSSPMAVPAVRMFPHLPVPESSLSDYFAAQEAQPLPDNSLGTPSPDGSAGSKPNEDLPDKTPCAESMQIPAPVSGQSDVSEDLPDEAPCAGSASKHFSEHLWRGLPCYNTAPLRTYTGIPRYSRIQPSSVWLRARMTRLWARRFR